MFSQEPLYQKHHYLHQSCYVHAKVRFQIFKIMTHGPILGSVCFQSKNWTIQEKWSKYPPSELNFVILVCKNHQKGVNYGAKMEFKVHIRNFK